MLTPFFEQFLDNEQAQVLNAAFKSREYARGSYFTKKGQWGTQVGFIEKGLARSYYLDFHGKESTVCFVGEGSILVDPFVFYADVESKLYIEFMEPTRVHISTRDQLQEIYQNHPEINNLARKLAEESNLIMLQRIIERDTLPAAERYIRLMENKNLFHRIPLKHMASYLGITDSSLSRIRRELD